jgi:hypothetical protein
MEAMGQPPRIRVVVVVDTMAAVVEVMGVVVEAHPISRISH